MITVRTLCARRANAVNAQCARRERAVNTLQQLLARRKSVMDVLKTLCERCVDAVGTRWGRCVQAITGNFDILGVFRGDPTARWQVFGTLYRRCGIAVWCDRGFRKKEYLLSYVISTHMFAITKTVYEKIVPWCRWDAQVPRTTRDHRDQPHLIEIKAFLHSNFLSTIKYSFNSRSG